MNKQAQLVRLELPQNSYNIWIGPHVLRTAAAHLAALNASKAVIVTDENVWALYQEEIKAPLQAANIAYSSIAVPPGESSKSLDMLQNLYTHFANAHLGRKDVVIAFGGGVVGDLAGFAAATWMRGIRCVQVCTSLLAQVDSSVGGKTAIDLPVGKNLVGAFHQPSLVLANTSLLKTLPEREFRCGMAEVVKYGAIFDADLFSRLSKPVAEDDLPDLVRTCCQLKANTVQADEKDTGARMLLNFGHSFGHAIEKLGGYTRYNHGEGVAIGMILAAAFGEKAGLTPLSCRQKLLQVLQAQGLPTQCPYNAEEITGAMALDKKSRDNGLDLILLKQIGEAQIVWQPLHQIRMLLTEVL